ncbi:unnamed protein product [Prorocentrum cordatum]|uniref:Uncharacterized protein n=1 Tax=Prorocentrum cordatum TaxID=2364126 RepID=A0ABN9SJ86_9DINO|nr:unnamed protein product [Polarella glacialis]
MSEARSLALTKRISVGGGANLVTTAAMLQSLAIALITELNEKRVFILSGVGTFSVKSSPARVVLADLGRVEMAAEQLALLSGLVWWLASTAMFLVRAVKLDDGCQGLPMNIHDASINWLVTLVQSRTLYQVLGAAHVVSCFGNFFSIVQLCFAIVWMGGASLHEACLTLVAFGFAAPHAALAAERVASEWQQAAHFKGDGAAAACVPASAGSGVVLAVARSAALGPQLTVVLACADATAEEVPFWQCATSVVAVAAYASSLIACGAAPPRRRGAVSPPSLSELWASLAVDVLAAATLVLSFFHLASWQWWLLLAIFAALLASISLGPVRVLLVELVEPIMPLLDGGDKARPPTGPRRELSRQLARAAVALCAAASFRSSWGRWAALRGAAVATPPPPAWADHEGAGIRSDDPGDNVMMDEGAWNDHHFSDYGDMPYDDDDRDYFTDWSAEDLLLLKWRDSHDGEAMGAAADALGIKENDLIVRDSLPQHRLLLFEVRARARELLPEGGPALAWRRVSAAPSERLSAIAEAGFPPALDAALCERLSEREWDETDLSAADAEILSGALSLTDRVSSLFSNIRIIAIRCSHGSVDGMCRDCIRQGPSQVVHLSAEPGNDRVRFKPQSLLAPRDASRRTSVTLRPVMR